jgi:hypothetical protein
VIGIEAERVSNMTEEKVQKQTTIPITKAEPKNCVDYVDVKLVPAVKRVMLIVLKYLYTNTVYV